MDEKSLSISIFVVHLLHPYSPTMDEYLLDRAGISINRSQFDDGVGHIDGVVGRLNRVGGGQWLLW